MSKKIVLVGVVLLAVLVLASVSTFVVAWIYPDGTEDVKFEKFGPRADNLHIMLHTDDTAEFDAFDLGEFDVVDTPLPEEYITKWSNPPYNESIKVVP